MLNCTVHHSRELIRQEKLVAQRVTANLTLVYHPSVAAYRAVKEDADERF